MSEKKSIFPGFQFWNKYILALVASNDLWSRNNTHKMNLQKLSTTWLIWSTILLRSYVTKILGLPWYDFGIFWPFLFEVRLKRRPILKASGLNISSNLCILLKLEKTQRQFIILFYFYYLRHILWPCLDKYISRKMFCFCCYNKYGKCSSQICGQFLGTFQTLFHDDSSLIKLVRFSWLARHKRAIVQFRPVNQISLLSFARYIPSILVYHCNVYMA